MSALASPGDGERLDRMPSELRNFLLWANHIQERVLALEAALAVQQAALNAAYDWFVRNTVQNEKTTDGSPAVFGMLMTARQDPTASSVLMGLQDAVREECAKRVCSGCADGLPVRVAHWAPNALNHIDLSKPWDTLYGPDQFACQALWNPAHRSRTAEAVAL